MEKDTFTADCKVCKEITEYEKIKDDLAVCLKCSVVQRIYGLNAKTKEIIKNFIMTEEIKTKEL